MKYFVYIGSYNYVFIIIKSFNPQYFVNIFFIINMQAYNLCFLCKYMFIIIINPRRARAARVTVVVSCVCVCLYVCRSAHTILAVRAIKSITKDTVVLSIRFAAILKWRFS